MKIVTDVGAVKDMLLRTYFHPDCFKLATRYRYGALRFKTQVSIDDVATDVVASILCYGRKYDKESLHYMDDGVITEFINVTLWRDRVDSDALRMLEPISVVCVKVKYQTVHVDPKDDCHTDIREFEVYPDLFAYDKGTRDKLTALMFGTICAGLRFNNELLTFKDAASRTPELEVSNSDILVISRALDEAQFGMLEKFIEITKQQPLKE